MILPLIVIIIASWLLILFVVAGLCLGAHQGDLQQMEAAPVHPASDLTEPSVTSPQITVQPSRRVPVAIRWG